MCMVVTAVRVMGSRGPVYLNGVTMYSCWAERFTVYD